MQQKRLSIYLPNETNDILTNICNYYYESKASIIRLLLYESPYTTLEYCSQNNSDTIKHTIPLNDSQIVLLERTFIQSSTKSQMVSSLLLTWVKHNKNLYEKIEAYKNKNPYTLHIPLPFHIIHDYSRLEKSEQIKFAALVKNTLIKFKGD